MNRVLALIAAVCMLSVIGCGGDTGKGINSDKDKPKPVQVEN